MVHCTNNFMDGSQQHLTGIGMTDDSQQSKKI